MIVVILYTFIAAIFICSLLMYTSFRQTQRQVYWCFLILLMVIFMGVFFGCVHAYRNGSRTIFNDNNPAYFATSLVVFGYLWPQIIGRLIIQIRIGKAFVKLKPELSRTIIGLLMTASFVWMLSPILALIFDGIQIPNHSPVFNNNDMWLIIMSITLALPGMLLGLVIAFQGTAFYANGLLHDGLFWSWEDFQAYTWWEKSQNGINSNLNLKHNKSWQLAQKDTDIVVPIKDKSIIQELLKKQNLTDNSY